MVSQRFDGIIVQRGLRLPENYMCDMIIPREYLEDIREEEYSGMLLDVCESVYGNNAEGLVDRLVDEFKTSVRINEEEGTSWIGNRNVWREYFNFVRVNCFNDGLEIPVYERVFNLDARRRVELGVYDLTGFDVVSVMEKV